MNTKKIGDVGESLARNVYEQEGYTVLETNTKYAGCEADLICECYVDENGNVQKRKKKSSFVKFFHKLLGIEPLEKGERTIVFVEVKTRYGEEMGAPEEAVTPYKVGRYVTAAKAFLSEHRLQNVNVRFDIFAVDENGYNLIENAFTENDAKYPKNRVSFRK